MSELYECKYCNKFYSSKSSRCNHIKRYHQNETSTECQQMSTESKQDRQHIVNICKPNNKEIVEEDDDYYECSFCDKTFKFRQSRWRHEQKCETKNKNQNSKITKSEYNELKKMLLNLQNSIKIHPKKLNKINNLQYFIEYTPSARCTIDSARLIWPPHTTS